MKNGIIDLHVHSNYSDGRRSLEFLKNKVQENNIRVISLTEHYTLSSYPKFKAMLKPDVEVLPGIELGSSLLSLGLSKNHVCHILAYFPNTKIYTILDQYELSRKKCVLRTIELLRKEGIDISYSKVIKTAKNPESIGRFDIATTLCKMGYAKTPAKAYSDFFDISSHIYIDREKMEPDTLIKNLLLCGGVPIIAHPKTLKLNNSDFFQFVKTLKEYGIQGIEAYNAHNTEEQRNFYLEICNEFDLLPTVGTDYHGRRGEEVNIGTGIDNNLCISDYSIVQNLKKRHKHLFD